jgi:hypothetical protein
MALNASGPISLAGATAGQSIAVELGLGTTTQISLDQANVRTLAGVPSGAIIMPTNFYGKANRVALSVTFSANTANATVAIASIPGYIAGTSDITVTINSGVYLFATSTGASGLTFSGGSSGDTLTIVNNGFIIGQGGNGGDQTAAPSTPGGPALSLSYPATINNTNPAAFVAGGGGGGGFGGNNVAGGGGGAGGGNGGGGTGGVGGAGGGLGAAGANGSPSGAGGGFGGGAGGGGGGVDNGGPKSPGVQPGLGGGGGGKVLPGVGGAGGVGTNPAFGGAGGSANAGGTPSSAGAGGGGWGASGGSTPRNGGGAGGRAVTLNGQTVTWVSGNTSRVYGAVS